MAIKFKILILCALEDGVKFETFTVISVDSLLAYESKYYLQAYLDNCAYKNVDKQKIDYLDDNIMKISFLILINGCYKCYATIELI